MDLQDPAQRARAVTALLVVQVLFGVHYSVAIEVVKEIPPTAWAVIRCVGAALVIGALVPLTGRRWPRRGRDWLVLSVLGVLGVSCNQVLFIEGISRSFAIHAVLVMATIPLQTLFLAVLLRQEQLSARKLLSVGAGVAGVVVLLRVDQVFQGEVTRLFLDSSGNETDHFWSTVLAGDLLMLMNAFSFSLFLALAKKPSQHFDSMTLTATTFVAGSLAVTLYGFPQLIEVDFSAVSWRTWALGSYTILGATVGTYLLNFYAMRRVPASIVSQFIYLQFIVAAIVGVAWHGESFDLRLVLSSVLVLGGLSLRLLARERTKMA